jgi:hypothetical protein
VKWVAVAAALGWLLLVPAPARAQEGDVYDWAGWRRGVNPEALRCLAQHESGHQDYPRPNGIYWGRMQFDWPTWRYGSALAGWAGYSPHDAEAAVDTAAYLIAIGQGGRWPPLRRYCWQYL